MKKKNREDIQVPMPGQNPPPEPKEKKHGKYHHADENEGKKRRKKKHHVWPWILLIVLLIGILLGILLDRGVFSIPGGPGEGFIGDTFNKLFSKEIPDEPIDIDKPVTHAPSPVPTVPIDENVATAYVTVSGRTIKLNGLEIDINDLLKQLTGPYKGAEVILLNDYAITGPYDNVKTVLENNGIIYKEQHQD